MITKHITEVTTRFNPFTRSSKTCRVFLAHLPANARSTMKINTTVLGRESQEPSLLKLKFSTCFVPRRHIPLQLILADQTFLIEDGKEMQMDIEKLKINDVAEEVDRHSRALNRQADLAGN